MSHRCYAIGAHVEWPSIGNRERIFFGTITGYSEDNSLAFIRDDNWPKSRPVRADRITGRAPFPEPSPHIPDLVA